MRLEAFAGDWLVERSIEDVREARHGRFSGLVRFTPEPGGLHYREEGRLRLGDAPEMTATRDYHWRAGEGGAIEVYFADGRFFHRFVPDEDAPGDRHECAPDTYRVRYDFARWPHWQASWRVTGPRKDYAMLSRFRRRSL